MRDLSAICSRRFDVAQRGGAGEGAEAQGLGAWAGLMRGQAALDRGEQLLQAMGF